MDDKHSGCDDDGYDEFDYFYVHEADDDDHHFLDQYDQYLWSEWLVSLLLLVAVKEKCLS